MFLVIHYSDNQNLKTLFGRVFSSAHWARIRLREKCFTFWVKSVDIRILSSVEICKKDEKGLGETGTIAIAVSGSILFLALLICLTLVCCRRCCFWAKRSPQSWQYFCFLFAKVDFEPNFQGRYQQRIRDLSGERRRHCDGGCRPEHRVRAAGGWWGGSSNWKAGLRDRERVWQNVQRVSARTGRKITKSLSNSFYHSDWLRYIAHDVERINLALRLPEKVNDIASEKIGQHALLCNKKAINKRSGLDAFPTEFTHSSVLLGF